MPNTYHAQALDWLVDLCAAEPASTDVLALLDEQAGYHLCDDAAALMPVQAAKRELVDRLLACARTPEKVLAEAA